MTGGWDCSEMTQPIGVNCGLLRSMSLCVYCFLRISINQSPLGCVKINGDLCPMAMFIWLEKKDDALALDFAVIFLDKPHFCHDDSWWSNSQTAPREFPTLEASNRERFECRVSSAIPSAEEHQKKEEIDAHLGFHLPEAGHGLSCNPTWLAETPTHSVRYSSMIFPAIKPLDTWDCQGYHVWLPRGKPSVSGIIGIPMDTPSPSRKDLAMSAMETSPSMDWLKGKS